MGWSGVCEHAKRSYYTQQSDLERSTAAVGRPAVDSDELVSLQVHRCWEWVADKSRDEPDDPKREDAPNFGKDKPYLHSMGEEVRKKGRFKKRGVRVQDLTKITEEGVAAVNVRSQRG